MNWELDENGWCPEADEWENQKLCAAAPELLEALKECLGWLEAAFAGEYHDSELNDILERADSAIAKATK